MRLLLGITVDPVMPIKKLLKACHSPQSIVPSSAQHLSHGPYSLPCTRLADRSRPPGGTVLPCFAGVAVPGALPHHTSASARGCSPAIDAACNSFGAQQSPAPAGMPVKLPARVSGSAGCDCAANTYAGSSGRSRPATSCVTYEAWMRCNRQCDSRRRRARSRRAVCSSGQSAPPPPAPLRRCRARCCRTCARPAPPNEVVVVSSSCSVVWAATFSRYAMRRDMASMSVRERTYTSDVLVIPATGPTHPGVWSRDRRSMTLR